MRLICIDTSGAIARWAGVEDGIITGSVTVEAGKKHDAVLAEGILAWMGEKGWSKPDAIAVVIGPGGYTGLRVGVAFATAFATAYGIPVVPVYTYELFTARIKDADLKAWTLLPIRKGVCRGRIMSSGVLTESITEPVEVNVGETIAPVEGKIIPIGDGYDKYKSEFDKLLGDQLQENYELIDQEEALGLISWRYYQDGRLLQPQEIDVEYGAEFQPTPKKKK